MAGADQPRRPAMRVPGAVEPPPAAGVAPPLASPPGQAPGPAARRQWPARSARRFRADFERAREAPRIPLHVLPPRGPRWNGCVERANRSARIEFWNLCDGPLTVSDAAPKLARHEFFHNHQRPHWALDCRTPNEYLVETEENA